MLYSGMTKNAGFFQGRSELVEKKKYVGEGRNNIQVLIM